MPRERAPPVPPKEQVTDFPVRRETLRQKYRGRTMLWRVSRGRSGTTKGVTSGGGRVQEPPPGHALRLKDRETGIREILVSFSFFPLVSTALSSGSWPSWP